MPFIEFDAITCVSVGTYVDSKVAEYLGTKPYLNSNFFECLLYEKFIKPLVTVSIFEVPVPEPAGSEVNVPVKSSFDEKAYFAPDIPSHTD